MKDFVRRSAGSKDDGDQEAPTRGKSSRFCMSTRRVTSWWRWYACEWRRGAASSITIITIKWPRRECRMEWWPCSRGRESAHLWITVTICQFAQAKATVSGQASTFEECAENTCFTRSCVRSTYITARRNRKFEWFSTEWIQYLTIFAESRTKKWSS